MKPTKTILLAGTKEHSIARMIGETLHAEGWDIWLYSRSAKRVERERWHERRCDIGSELQIKQLLAEIPRVDAVAFSADANGHGIIRDVSEQTVKAFVTAKITGSVLLTKALLKKNQPTPIKLIWIMGKIGLRPADLALYAIVNAGIVGFVNQLNATEKTVRAFVLTLGVISPSTLGDEYIRTHPGQKFETDKPQAIAAAVHDILSGGAKPGIVPRDQSKLV